MAGPATRLRLHPFRAIRYDPAVIGDVGDVTSPPYDVLDRVMVEDLLQSHPRNVVRLILPRLVGEPLGAEDAYATAAKRLGRWRRQGTLLTDPEPGLYVYEYGQPGAPICGLVGAIELAKPSRRLVLPHEGVIPDIVADRLAGIAASRANLEPILLVYDGDPVASGQVAAARNSQPVLEATAADGSEHRLWPITDAAALESLSTALAPHRTLIADGHHRYAAYQALRRHHHAAGHGSGPWDRGLALLIDQSKFPLQLGAIHRSLAEADWSLLRQSPDAVIETPPETETEPRPPTAPSEIVVTDGVSTMTLRMRPELVDDLGTSTAVGWLHERLLPAWQIGEDRLGYHHTAEQAVHSARRDGGLAVLLPPLTTQQVMAVARSGRMLPRKSTSFRPKPRMGVVMRSFDDEA